MRAKLDEVKQVLNRPKSLLNSVEGLKQKYCYDCLRQVSYCRDEIRGLTNQYRRRGFGNEVIEQEMGDYLDEVYSDYLEVAQDYHGLTEEEFDHIYNVMEEIDGPVIL